MKTSRTLVFAILFLTTLAGGLLAAPVPPAGAGACDGPAWLQAASSAASPAELAIFAKEGAGQDCLSFCSIAFCPEGGCGPLPGGGCGCQGGGGGVLLPGN